MSDPRAVGAVSLALMLAACGGSDDPDAQSASTTTVAQVTTSTTTATSAPSTSTTTRPSTTTTTATTTTTERRSTSTSAKIENPGPMIPAEGPTLDDGRPATFLAVTAESTTAVEVDTVTGSIVREIGSTGNEGSGSALEGNVVVDAWWDPASGHTIISTCCEPAAGDLTFLEAGEGYRYPTAGDSSGFGWDASVSPDGSFYLLTGYYVRVQDAADPSEYVDLLEAFDGTGRHPAWLRDRRGVAVAHPWDFEGGTELGWVEVIELDEANRVISSIRHEVPEGVADLEVRADGRLVVLLGTGQGYAAEGNRVVVMDPDTGDRLTEFDLGAESYGLSYDNTGTYLLYVTTAGEIRWQGAGRSGELADGFISADW